jgi:hypothetical protein
MSTPSNAVPALIRADSGGNLYYSLDGGQTFNPAIAGGGSLTLGANGLLTGAGTAGSPLTALAQFGQDTTVSINDSGGTPVSALELIASLTTTTPGSTASQWLVKLLTAGAQVSAFQATPKQFLVPLGSAGVPGISFIGQPGFGLHYDGGIVGTVVDAAGAAHTGFFGQTLLIYGGAAIIAFGSDQAAMIARSGTALIFTTNNTERIRINGTGIGFYAATPVAKPTVSGSKAANAALASLMTALSTLGLVTDSTT